MRSGSTAACLWVRLIGIEACGNSHWFIDLLGRLGHQVWVGDAAKIRASYVRKQKTDQRDAAHILTLLLEKRFPKLWTPSRQAARSAAAVDSSPQAGADTDPGQKQLAAPGPESGSAKETTSCGARTGQKLLVQLPLEGWTAVRRQDCRELLAHLDAAHCQVGQGGRAGRRSSIPKPAC